MNLRLKNNQGFTLIELVIVLSIFAIVASAAVSAFVDIANKAYGVQEDATMRSLQSGALLYYAKNNRWWGTIGAEDPFLVLENPPPRTTNQLRPVNTGFWIINLWNPTPSTQAWDIICPHMNLMDIDRGYWYRFYVQGARYYKYQSYPH